MKPIGTRVDVLGSPGPTPTPGAAQAFPPSLPGGWVLSGGPADYTAQTAGESLKEELPRFRGLVSYAGAEYSAGGQRVVALETFVMSTTSAAGGALALGRPADARPLHGDDLDDGFSAGLKAEARKGVLLVRVRWFEEEDRQLPDAAIEAMRDVLAEGVKHGLSQPKP